jgi:tetratricopeptide (TPR) repeat protein
MKKFDDARDTIGKSLTVLHKRGGNDRSVAARINLQLGLVCLDASDAEAAVSFLEHALSEFETVGNCQLDFAECLQGLGKVSLAKKDPHAARDWFMRSLRLRQEMLDSGDARVGESLHLLGICLAELQDYHEAGSYLSESLSIRIRKFGADDRLVGETHRCLAQVEMRISNPTTALKHYEKAINIAMSTLHETTELRAEDFHRLFECIEVALDLAKPGKNDKQLGKLCHQRGSLQCKRKLYRDALESFSLAIRHYKECFGDVHLTVANVFFNMGVCLNATGDPERASQCLMKALRITTAELGGDHPEAAEAMEHLGESCKQLGDIEKSLFWCEKALAIRKHTEDLTLAALLHFTGDLVRVL